MTENTDRMPQEPESMRHEAENLSGEAVLLDETSAARGMKRQYNRIGWALVTVVFVWQVLMLLVGIVMSVIELTTGLAMVDAYYRYLLLINEAALAVGILAGAQVLRGIPCHAPEKRPFSVGQFIILLCICYAASIAGNLVGNLVLGIWNALTGRSVGSEVTEILTETNPIVNLLAVGIMAPVLEELLMRKLVIDRTRVYGERVCILTSAALFALFHMNFSQMFYAFGVGLLLAYLYCRSGKIWLCMLLHAIFNCISGVLRAEILTRFTKIFEPLANLTEEELAEKLPELVQNHGLFILLAAFYFIAIFAMVIAGIVLLIVKARQFRPEPGEVTLSAKSRRTAILKNPGMIAAVIVFLGFTIYSLFV